MASENICGKEMQDWKAAVIFVLRRWFLLLLIVAGITAAFAKSRLDKGPDPVYTEAELTTMNDQLVQNTNTIEKDKNNIAAYENTLAEQQKTMASYRETLAELERQLEAAEDDSVKLSVSNQINSANSSIMSVQAQISGSEQNINGLKSEIATLESKNASIREKLAAIPQTVGKGELVKAALIGAFAGMFAGWILLLFWYLFSDRLQNAEELARVYGYYVLGSVHACGRWFGIGRLLDRWEGYPSRLNQQEEYDRIAARIELFQDGQEGKLAITGTVDIKKIQAVAEGLKSFWTQTPYTITVLPNPVYDADSLRKLKDYTVIVVEGKKISRKSEITKLTNLLRTGQVTLRGAIEV